MIITIGHRDDEIDPVAGLLLGADDYVTKPLGLQEPLARVRAVLRMPGVLHRGATAADLAAGTSIRTAGATPMAPSSG